MMRYTVVKTFFCIQYTNSRLIFYQESDNSGPLKGPSLEGTFIRNSILYAFSLFCSPFYLLVISDRLSPVLDGR